MRLAKHPAEYELEKIELYRRKVDTLRNEIKHIDDTKAVLKSVTYTQFKTNKNWNYSPVETAVISADDQKARIAKHITKCLEAREHLINNVLSLESSDHVTLLTLLFIECRAPMQVWDKMGYSESWFLKNRRKALQAYSDAFMNDSDPAGTE